MNIHQPSELAKSAEIAFGYYSPSQADFVEGLINQKRRYLIANLPITHAQAFSMTSEEVLDWVDSYEKLEKEERAEMIEDQGQKWGEPA